MKENESILTVDVMSDRSKVTLVAKIRIKNDVPLSKYLYKIAEEQEKYEKKVHSVLVEQNHKPSAKGMAKATR